MKQVLAFRLDGCPYCRQAIRATNELFSEDEKYAAVEIKWVEENDQPELASKHDYYYVPAMFVDGVKVYEAHPGESYMECKANVKRVFDETLADSSTIA